MEKNVPVKIVVGSVEKAIEYFEKNNLDPGDKVSWTAAACSMDEMPDVIIEEIKSPGGFGYNYPVTASVSCISHDPNLSGIVDCFGAVVSSGNKELARILAWPNPLSENAPEAAIRHLVWALQKYGIQNISILSNTVPFEADLQNLVLKTQNFSSFMKVL